MNIINYIRNKGIHGTLVTIYKYKIDKMLQLLMKPLFINKKLKDIIVIESHNDFDSNGGAFYDYLIKNEYNNKYKIVWLLKNPNEKPNELPKNVTWVPLFKPSIKKDYYFWNAKFFTYDCECRGKLRDDQFAIYFTHGPVSLKKPKGLLDLPLNMDAYLTASNFMAPISANIFGYEYPNDKEKILGFPIHDTLYTPSNNEINKISNQKYDHYILWMPTFRKLKESSRNDSTEVLPLGIPVIKNQEEFEKLQSFLDLTNTLLIIKIHPMQDLSTLKIQEKKNIKILDGDLVKKLNIDNYRLMKDCDALISDYSSAAFDYLHLDRQLAFTIDDISNYKLGFIVDDPKTLLAGSTIKNIQDLNEFINDVVKDNDVYKNKRHEIFDILFKYHDGNSCKRIAEFMKL